MKFCILMRSMAPPQGVCVCVEGVWGKCTILDPPLAYINDQILQNRLHIRKNQTNTGSR